METKTRFIPYNQHPVVFADLFILLPVDLQNTFVYAAQTGKLIGIINAHTKTIKWLVECEMMFDAFEKASGEMEGGWACVGFAVDFEEHFGNTRVEMSVKSNKYDFLPTH